MPMTSNFAISLSMLIVSASAQAHPSVLGQFVAKPILADAKLLEAVGVPIWARDTRTGVAYAVISPETEMAISRKAHEWNRCGGFEALPTLISARSEDLNVYFRQLNYMQDMNERYQKWKETTMRKLRVVANPSIEQALAKVDPNALQNWVKWFSAYPTRFNRAPTANDHVIALRDRLVELTRNAPIPVQIDLIEHKSTPQKSLRVRLLGSARPNEIVVLGAHFDSINMNGGKAPGADDNASGSSNILEALRIAIQQGVQPQRTLEFMLYAGEESGLLGSAEIARDYRAQKKDVIGVLQLDMTMYPGDGVFTLGSMTDFTAAWLRDYLVELNKVYIHAKIINDQCGYGCSDHASWHRQGYSALMPFEATMRNMNQNLHTTRDVIDAKSNFDHSAMFAKIAVAFSLDLGNSTLRQPTLR